MGHNRRFWYYVRVFIAYPVGVESRYAKQNALWPTGCRWAYRNYVLLYDDQPVDGYGAGSCGRHSPALYQPRRVVDADHHDLRRHHHVN